MQKETISNWQGISMMVLFILGSSIVLGVSPTAGQDIWISLIVAIILALVIGLIYARLIVLYPNTTIYKILEKVLGKWLGKIIALCMTWYAFYLGSLVLDNFAEFIFTTALRSTPSIVVLAFMIFLVIWGVKAGVEVLGRWSQMFGLLLITLIISTDPLLIPQIESNTLEPLLGEGFIPIFQGAYNTFTFPFAETVVFLGVLDSLEKKNGSYSIFMKGILIGGGILLLTSTTEILVLGEFAYDSAYFPAYAAVSRINIADILQRMEIIVAVAFLISGFMKVCICMLSCCKGLQSIFDLEDYRFLVTPVGIIAVIIALTTYGSIIEMFQWAFTSYNLFALPYQLIIPILVWGIAEGKHQFKTFQKKKH